MGTGVQVLRNTDPGAPVLDYQQGSKLSVLDWALVTKAGWSKPYSSASVGAVYRQAAGSQMYLQVYDDSITTIGNGAVTHLMGFETMSSLTAGTGQFATDYDNNAAHGTPASGTGLYVLKTTQSGVGAPLGTHQKYLIILDNRTIYFFWGLKADDQTIWDGWMFGDIASRLGSDAYACMLICDVSGQAAALKSWTAPYSSTVFSSSQSIWAIARNFRGTAGSLQRSSNVGQINLFPDQAKFVSSAGNLNVGPISGRNPVDTRYYFGRVGVAEVTLLTVRGYMRGFWHWEHTLASLSDGQEFIGDGVYAGRRFLGVKGLTNGGAFIVETSDTWTTTSTSASVVTTPYSAILVDHEQPSTVSIGPPTRAYAQVVI